MEKWGTEADRNIHMPWQLASFSWTSLAGEVESSCSKFYSEEVKHMAVNRFSVAEAELYSKEQIKNVYIYICKYTYLNM